MKLSIIVPIFNTRAYLPECLESLANQNIPASDYEIICVDDGSSDGSGTVVDQCAEKYSNLKVIHQKNAGVSVARNAGIAAASGEYVWFVDSDDLVPHNCLRYLTEKTVEAGSPDRLMFFYYQFTGDLTEAERKAAERRELPPNSTNESIVVSWFKREIIAANHLTFSEKIRYGEDNVFICAFQALHLPQFVLNEAFYFYRVHQSSTTRKKGEEANLARLDSFIEAAGAIRKIYENEQPKSSRTANDLAFFVRGAVMLMAQKKKASAKPYLEKLRKASLFPMKRLPEETLHSTYTTSRTDLVGKVFNWLTMHCTYTWGYRLMRTWYAVFRCLKR